MTAPTKALFAKGAHATLVLPVSVADATASAFAVWSLPTHSVEVWDWLVVGDEVWRWTVIASASRVFDWTTLLVPTPCAKFLFHVWFELAVAWAIASCELSRTASAL